MVQSNPLNQYFDLYSNVDIEKNSEDKDVQKASKFLEHRHTSYKNRIQSLSNIRTDNPLISPEYLQANSQLDNLEHKHFYSIFSDPNDASIKQLDFTDR